MTNVPDAIFIVDAVRDNIAVHEANSLKIPIFGICDSNADPDFFTIPIPANDDAVNSVKLVLGTVEKALVSSGGQKEEKKETEEVA